MTVDSRPPGPTRQPGLAPGLHVVDRFDRYAPGTHPPPRRDPGADAIEIVFYPHRIKLACGPVHLSPAQALRLVADATSQAAFDVAPTPGRAGVRHDAPPYAESRFPQVPVPPPPTGPQQFNWWAPPAKGRPRSRWSRLRERFRRQR